MLSAAKTLGWGCGNYGFRVDVRKTTSYNHSVHRYDRGQRGIGALVCAPAEHHVGVGFHEQDLKTIESLTICSLG